MGVFEGEFIDAGMPFLKMLCLILSLRFNSYKLQGGANKKYDIALFELQKENYLFCDFIHLFRSNELGAGYNSFSLPALMTSSLPRGPITLDWTLDLGLWLAPAVQIPNWIWEMAQFYNHCQPETDPSMERERLLTNNHVTLPRWLHIVGFPPHAECWWCHWPH